MNDAVLIDVVEHLVQNGGDDRLRTTSNCEGEGSGVEIAGERLRGENGFSLEEIPFPFVLNQGNKSSDKVCDQSVR